MGDQQQPCVVSDDSLFLGHHVADAPAGTGRWVAASMDICPGGPVHWATADLPAGFRSEDSGV